VPPRGARRSHIAGDGRCGRHNRTAQRRSSAQTAPSSRAGIVHQSLLVASERGSPARCRLPRRRSGAGHPATARAITTHPAPPPRAAASSSGAERREYRVQLSSRSAAPSRPLGRTPTASIGTESAAIQRPGPLRAASVGQSSRTECDASHCPVDERPVSEGRRVSEERGSGWANWPRRRLDVLFVAPGPRGGNKKASRRLAPRLSSAGATGRAVGSAIA
jgi:hypothetical protein